MFLNKLLPILIIFHACSAQDDEECPTILTKSEWGGRAATSINHLIVPIPYVVIQHTVSPECTSRATCSSRVKGIQDYHMDDLEWSDIGYSFVIGGDGNVYEGCGWTVEGAHTYGYNKRSIGIAFIGNFQAKQASQAMLNAAHKLIRCGVSQGILRENVHVIAARQVTSTASPGYELFTQIQEWPEWQATV